MSAPLKVDALFTPGLVWSFITFRSTSHRCRSVCWGLGGFCGAKSIRVGSTVRSRCVTMPKASRSPFAGRLGEVRLEELAASLLDQPVRGRVDIMLDEAVISQRELETLTFRGSLSDVRLDDVAQLANVPGLTGLVNLRAAGPGGRQNPGARERRR
ncbi:MAG: hypothetical protein R3E58_13665 [Phycisphaerae bacterium]